ncbi:radical SAM protein [candidate division CSSED10-310 bacterium]|uniref:Radical SAM protein n=1 Tax=candidate division CSSED10-310 bacterium TaxID=2855610 RepID=A0ABV6Z3Q6_UNCC1
MTVNEIEAKSLLRKSKKIDSWFISRYGMNLYRGCFHNCVYCDGRAEGYYVEGEFGEDVAVKVNAVEVLRRELDPRRKRIPLKRCYMFLGGGVGDSYQPLEQKYQLSRQVLQLILEHNFPVHVLTKSTLVIRDLDLLKRINEHSRALVSFSFSSTDDTISAIFEPHVPAPSARLKTITRLKQEGISCGMFLLPVIPFITDSPRLLEESVRQAREAGVDFIVFGGMTLKDGRQKAYFHEKLSKNYPDLLTEYQEIYGHDKWGAASGKYYAGINRMFNSIATEYKMPQRIPLAYYRDILDENDLVVVILEHIDYFLKMRGEKSPYGYAAYSISQVKEPLSMMKGKLLDLKGVGRVTERIVLDILETGTSSYYHSLAGSGPDRMPTNLS